MNNDEKKHKWPVITTRITKTLGIDFSESNDTGIFVKFDFDEYYKVIGSISEKEAIEYFN